jgi:predicted ATPase
MIHAPLHLRTIHIPQPTDFHRGYPFSLPLMQSFGTLELRAPVTYFVGENGSGKSTLMEAIACAVGATTVGSASVTTDPTLTHARKLGKTMKLSWSKRTQRGFFLRAEDYFGFVKQVEATKAELEEEMRRVDREYENRSDYAKGFAKMPFARELHDIREKYGEGLDTQSHGESFLALFQARFVPNGLYLLDEPEAALSPLRQIGFLSLLKEMVETHNAQFIIATHAPILMAYPGAEILDFNQHPPQPTSYKALEHVSLTRDFLNHPERYLRYL